MGRSIENGLRRARAGFTLVELMIVVAILGILAAVSLPSLSSYIYKSKAVEATGFLNEMKSRQESYRADFGQYCDVSGGPDNLFPSATPRSTVQDWPNPIPPPNDTWTQLGVVPPGRKSLFVYSMVAGVPPAVPSAAGFSSNRGFNGTDFWFIATALGDLDGDGTRVRFESYSHSKAIWTDLSSGWE
jgi:prepilin-type N-terminal cleavage/methylation domain-containing protein